MAPTFRSSAQSTPANPAPVQSPGLKGRSSDLLRLVTLVTAAVAVSWVFRLG